VQIKITQKSVTVFLHKRTYVELQIEAQIYSITHVTYASNLWSLWTTTRYVTPSHTTMSLQGHH